MGPAPLLGLLCGARAEAAALGLLAEDPRIAIRYSGGDAHAAARAAQALAALGCRGLVSFGTAGGLDPALRAGARLSPGAVIDGQGGRWPLDPGLTPCGGASGALLSVAAIAHDPAEKAAHRRATGAAALDMESVALARAAAAAGLPCGAIRVVMDAADRSLPRAAAAGLGPDGTTRPRALARALLRRPADLPAMLATARAFARARAALARAAGAVIPGALAALSEAS